MLSEARFLKLNDVDASGLIQDLGLRGGSIEYSDSTHCAQGSWTRLARVPFQYPDPPLVGSENAHGYYSISVALEKKSHILEDTLAQVLLRCGILRPQFTRQTLNDLFSLAQSRAVVLVPDTNALSTGTLSWLLKILPDTHVWLLPVVISLIQVQQRHAQLKNLLNEKNRHKPGNIAVALRSRQMVNASLSLLERQRERYQILEVDPQLLRYVRPGGSAAGDHDQSDILEDRLLMEAIHAAIRATRSRAEKAGSHFGRPLCAGTSD